MTLSLSPIQRRLLLALYIAAVLVVWLVVQFPSEELRAFVGRSLSASLPGLSVSVAAVRPTLTAGLALQGVRIMQGSRNLAELEQLDVQPDWLTALEPRRSYNFSGTLAGGEINGRAEIDPGGSPAKNSLTARLGAVQLQQIPALQGLYGARLAGRLEGSLNASEAGAVNAKITVTDARVELGTPVFEQNSFTFRSVDAELILQNQSLLVRNGRLKGNELDAEVAGTILLDPGEGARALNISGRVTPQHAFLARLEGKLPVNLLRRRAGIPFRVSGALDAPGLSFN